MNLKHMKRIITISSNFHGFFDSLFKQEEKVSFGFYSQFSGHIYCEYKVESK